MHAVAVSVLVGLLGFVGTRLGVARLVARTRPRDPHEYWLLGIVGLR